LSLEDIPASFADFFGINETAAQLILSITIIFMFLFPTMILSKGKNATTVWLIMVLFGELVCVAFGWLPFWVLIATVGMMSIAIALLGARVVVGGE
jgi:hypothetical protein